MPDGEVQCLPRRIQGGEIRARPSNFSRESGRLRGKRCCRSSRRWVKTLRDTQFWGSRRNSKPQRNRPCPPTGGNAFSASASAARRARAKGVPAIAASSAVSGKHFTRSLRIAARKRLRGIETPPDRRRGSCDHGSIRRRDARQSSRLPRSPQGRRGTWRRRRACCGSSKTID